MSKVGISIAEKRLMEHLRRGGTPVDAVGRELVQQFVAKASRDSDVHRIIVELQPTTGELELVVVSSIASLMPNPCIQVGGPMLVPTLLFMEPEKLRDLLVSVNRDSRGVSLDERFRLLTSRSMELAALIQSAHDEARGPVNFRIAEVGGLASSRTSGCLLLLLAPVPIGLTVRFLASM